MIIYVEERQKLYEELKGVPRVSLTTNLWTSIQNLRCITAHYINAKWRLQKRIINFCVIPHPHTGEDLGKALDACLLGWDIEKLCTVTVDYANNNEGMIKYLKMSYLN